MNRILLLVATLFLLTDCLPAQVGTWFSLNLYPNYANRRLIVLDNLTRQQIDRIDSLEYAKPAYSVGGAIQWRGEFLGLQIGANLANMGYRTLRDRIPTDDPNAGLAEEQELRNTTYLLEVPIEFSFYQQLNDKNELYFVMGSGLAYHLSSTTHATLYTGNRVETNSRPTEGDFRKVNLSFQTAMGWEHAFSPYVRMQIQPHFQFWLRGLMIDAPLTRNLYSIGLRLGIKFGRLVEYTDTE